MSRRVPPAGFAETAVWRLFEIWADAGLGRSKNEPGHWRPYWEAFCAGYAAKEVQDEHI